VSSSVAAMASRTLSGSRLCALEVVSEDLNGRGRLGRLIRRVVSVCLFERLGEVGRRAEHIVLVAEGLMPLLGAEDIFGCLPELFGDLRRIAIGHRDDGLVHFQGIDLGERSKSALLMA
jgi:hypothetical protein